jgi:hypothetical protein
VLSTDPTKAEWRSAAIIPAGDSTEGRWTIGIGVDGGGGYRVRPRARVERVPARDGLDEDVVLAATATGGQEVFATEEGVAVAHQLERKVQRVQIGERHPSQRRRALASQRDAQALAEITARLPQQRAALFGERQATTEVLLRHLHPARTPSIPLRSASPPAPPPAPPRTPPPIAQTALSRLDAARKKLVHRSTSLHGRSPAWYFGASGRHTAPPSPQLAAVLLLQSLPAQRRCPPRISLPLRPRQEVIQHHRDHLAQPGFPSHSHSPDIRQPRRIGPPPRHQRCTPVATDSQRVPRAPTRRDTLRRQAPHRQGRTSCSRSSSPTLHFPFSQRR